MTTRLALLSIHPDKADAILDGTKKYEYRRVAPKVQIGGTVVMYACTDRGIIGAFRVSEVVVDTVGRLITATVRATPHTEKSVREYFRGRRKGVALGVGETWPLDIPRSLIKELFPRFVSPQNFRYLSPVGDTADLYSEVRDQSQHHIRDGLGCARCPP